MLTPDAGAKRPHANTTLAMLTLVGVAFFAGFVALGLWQVQRLSWKLDLIERVTQRLATPPVPLPLPAQWSAANAKDHEYQPVRMQGVWLASKTVLTQANTQLGPGYWVLTPLQLAGGATVLVNRGFVPQDQRAKWIRQTPASQAAAPVTAPEPVTVEGLLRMSETGGGFLRANKPVEQRWYSRDVAAIGQALQLSHLAPFFVDAGIPNGKTTAEDSPVTPRGAWPRAGLTTVRFSNTHLVYALTWFGLAIMVVGAGVVVARYEVRLRAASRTLSAHEPH